MQCLFFPLRYRLAENESLIISKWKLPKDTGKMDLELEMCVEELEEETFI